MNAPTLAVRFRGFLAGTVAACVTLSAGAHSVWIEPTAEGRLVVRFAEPDGKLEKSPGHLDELTFPVAFSVITNGAALAVETVKKSDHFLLVGVASTNVAAAETTYIVMGAQGKPGRKPVFYARWHPAGAPPPVPALNLDLVPTVELGEVRVYLRGKPLGGVKAVLRSPDERERELTADEQGYLRFASDQKGLHHLRIARHRESLPGYHLGREHDLTSHNACLSWLQP